MADPVAEKSSFLCMYMSSHPDTLVAYAKWYGKVVEPITRAQMTGIDCKGMDLKCTFKDGSERPVRVAIEPPLNGYDDVKPRLLEMKAHAQEGLGMIKAPVINTFRFPRKAWGAVVMMVTCAYIAYAPVNHPSPVFTAAQIARSYVGRGPEYFFLLCSGVHVLEALYVANVCRKHKSGLIVGLQYFFSTIVAGFYMPLDLRKRIQTARIDSVMKIQ